VVDVEDASRVTCWMIPAQHTLEAVDCLHRQANARHAIRVPLGQAGVTESDYFPLWRLSLAAVASA
jgi:hypothetical protein